MIVRAMQTKADGSSDHDGMQFGQIEAFIPDETEAAQVLADITFHGYAVIGGGAAPQWHIAPCSHAWPMLPCGAFPHWDEVAFERACEARQDMADSLYLVGEVTVADYDLRCWQLREWAEAFAQYKREHA